MIIFHFFLNSLLFSLIDRFTRDSLGDVAYFPTTREREAILICSPWLLISFNERDFYIARFTHVYSSSSWLKRTNFVSRLPVRIVCLLIEWLFGLLRPSKRSVLHIIYAPLHSFHFYLFLTFAIFYISVYSRFRLSRSFWSRFFYVRQRIEIHRRPCVRVIYARMHAFTY